MYGTCGGRGGCDGDGVCTTGNGDANEASGGWVGWVGGLMLLLGGSTRCMAMARAMAMLGHFHFMDFQTVAVNYFFFF